MKTTDQTGHPAEVTDRRQAIAQACRAKCGEISAAGYQFPDAMHRSDWLLLAALTVVFLIVLAVGVYL